MRLVAPKATIERVSIVPTEAATNTRVCSLRAPCRSCRRSSKRSMCRSMRSMRLSKSPHALIESVKSLIESVNAVAELSSQLLNVAPGRQVARSGGRYCVSVAAWSSPMTSSNRAYRAWRGRSSDVIFYLLLLMPSSGEDDGRV